jgi:hypothetical protein
MPCTAFDFLVPIKADVCALRGRLDTDTEGENLLRLETFDTVEELRLALHEFRRQYNESWLIGRHGYKTPAQVRQEQRCPLAEAA